MLAGAVYPLKRRVLKEKIVGRTVYYFAVCLQHAPGGRVRVFVKRNQVQTIECSHIAQCLDQSVGCGAAIAARRNRVRGTQ